MEEVLFSVRFTKNKSPPTPQLKMLDSGGKRIIHSAFKSHLREVKDKCILAEGHKTSKK